MWKLKTAPAVEPITTSEAKLHLKLDSDTTDDTLIAALITAARETIENLTGRALINQTWEMALEEWPEDEDELKLYPSPLSSVTSVTYTDVDGITQTWSPTTGYTADTYSIPGQLLLRYGQYWPVNREIENSILITYVCGYGAASSSVPGPLKAAMLLLIGHWYENREAVNVGSITSELPFTVEVLIAPYRVIEL
jgi:uncharacterized phiE125 gp8 family phage protein